MGFHDPLKFWVILHVLLDELEPSLHDHIFRHPAWGLHERPMLLQYAEQDQTTHEPLK